MSSQIDVREMHWLFDMLNSVDVGLVVIDRDFSVHLWNRFMENHSGLSPGEVVGGLLFKNFDEIPQAWFRRKAESVFLLNSRSFMIWEQRPYLFRFKNYRPITGTAEFMYQNITLFPLSSADGKINHLGMIVYDVTEAAVNHMELETTKGELEVLSRTDGLTKLNNRAHWEECLKYEFSRLKRSSGEGALVMFDIDHFKKVNDTYGHQAGDEVIRVTSDTLRNNLRLTDIAGRYGGEEFSVILVDTSAENAKVFAERLRKDIETQRVVYQDAEIRFTISLGIAGFKPEMTKHENWIENSDQALYAAKEGGRNCFRIFNTG